MLRIDHGLYQCILLLDREIEGYIGRDVGEYFKSKCAHKICTKLNIRYMHKIDMETNLSQLCTE